MDKQLELDTQLNKTAFDLFTYTTIGYFSGIALSLFFKRKVFIRNMSAGVLAGYSLSENQEVFNKLIPK